MYNNICIPKIYFFLIISIFIVFTLFHTIRMKYIFQRENKNYKILKIKQSKKNKQCKKYKKYKQNNDYKQSNDNKQIKKNKQSNDNKQKGQDIDEIVIHVNKDNEEHDSKPPRRKYIQHDVIPIEELYNNKFNHIGLLIRKGDETFLKLYGRQKFPRSNQWEYYAIDKNDIKIPIEVKNQKEIYDKDIIPIASYDTTKGGFEVKLFKYDSPKYNPIVF